MAVEPQLIDYIKKARSANQTDQQSRALLYKNGWSAAEVDEAFAAASQTQAQPKVNAQQPQAQAQEPQIKIQTQQTQQPQAQQQPKAQSAVVNSSQFQPKLTQSIPQEAKMSNGKKSSHFVSKIIIILIILGVLAGAAFYASQYFKLDSLWKNFGRINPEIVIGNMLNNKTIIKTIQATSEIDLSVSSNKDKKSLGRLIINSKNKIDATNTSNPKTNGELILNLNLPGITSNAISAKISTALADNTAYFKIDDFTAVDFLLQYYPELVALGGKNNWIKIDQGSIKNLSSADIGTVNSQDLANKIRELVVTENLMSVVQQLNDEVIGGQNAYHYSVVISKEKISSFISKFMALAVQDAGTDLVKEMVAVFTKKIVDATGDINMEIWIGKNDYLLYQIKLNKTIDLDKIQAGLDKTISLKISITNTDFNKDLSIQTPENANKIEDVFLPVSKILNIRLNLNSIASIAQSVMSSTKNYSSLCTRGLLNGYLKDYGNTLISLNNDIIKQGGNKPACFAGATDFCISTQLSDGTYLCIGKNNTLGKIKCESSQTVCK